jgi:hypothetical protein
MKEFNNQIEERQGIIPKQDIVDRNQQSGDAPKQFLAETTDTRETPTPAPQKNKIIKPCKHCGKPIDTNLPNWKIRQKTFCDRRCHSEYCKNYPITFVKTHSYKKLKWFELLNDLINSPLKAGENDKLAGYFPILRQNNIPIRRLRIGQISQRNKIKSMKWKSPKTIYYIKGHELAVLKLIMDEYGDIPRGNNIVKALFGRDSGVICANGVKGIRFDWLYPEQREDKNER